MHFQVAVSIDLLCTGPYIIDLNVPVDLSYCTAVLRVDLNLAGLVRTCTCKII